MKIPLEVRCLKCRLVFCCATCRRKHELDAHNLTYECSICRQQPIKLRVNDVLDLGLSTHLVEDHCPLHCLKCEKHFERAEDFHSIQNCTSNEGNMTTVGSMSVTTKDSSRSPDDSLFKSSLYQNAESPARQNSSVMCSTENFVSSSGSTMTDGSKSNRAEFVRAPDTPYPRSKHGIPKDKSLVTPRALLSTAFEFEEQFEKVQEDSIKKLNHVDNSKETTNDDDTPKSEFTATPARMHATSTPTHPSAVPQWNMFQNTCSHSPLSEIDSPGADVASPPVSMSDIKEYPSTEKSSPDNGRAMPCRIKSIIAKTRRNLDRQDSSEKCVTFSDSVTVQTDGEISTERLKPADAQVASPRGIMLRKPLKRAFRRPRIQTPGPIKTTKRATNPRFEAILNHFQKASRSKTNVLASSSETPAGSTNMPARALFFHQNHSPSIEKSSALVESPLPEIKDSIINNENENIQKGIIPLIDSPIIDAECFKTCIEESPITMLTDSNSEATSDQDLKTLSQNIAACIKRSIDSALEMDDVKAELQIQVTFTKRKFNSGGEQSKEITAETKTHTTTIWTSIARAVNKVIWGTVEESAEKINTKTPEHLDSKVDSKKPDSDSASKRKLQEITDPIQSPLNHKKFRFEGRIKGRRPIDRMLRGTVCNLERSNSAGGVDLVKRIDQSFKNKNKDILNHSF